MQHNDIAGELRRLGYRLTPQRMLILSIIERSDEHITAEEIHEQVTVKFPGVNISTVYRTLELLKQLGLIFEIDNAEGKIGYHPEWKSHHHHLICRQCSRIIDVNEAVMYSVKAILLQAFDFEADLKHLAIAGLCEKCRKK